jgi:hypothetical protein
MRDAKQKIVEKKCAMLALVKLCAGFGKAFYLFPFKKR